MKPRIWIVHGIHTNEQEPWMYVYKDGFERAGWDATVWTYGKVSALTTRWKNPGRAKELAGLIQPGDYVLGHSNGGCLIWMAGELGAKYRGAILLNPALDDDKVLQPECKWVNLYPNRFDEAVPLAAWFGLHDLAPHPWGAQGRDGLTVKDARYSTTWTDPMVKGHSAMLAGPALITWRDRVIADAEARRADDTLPGLKQAA